MTIEYACTDDKCGYTFCDVKIIPMCKCPVCNAETEPIEWEGLED